jgi:hypothetical protein
MKYLYTLVEILHKHAPATCKPSYHKCMQEEAGITQVTAKTPAERGASNPDTGKRLFHSQKRPYWMTMSNTFQSSKYMGLFLVIILPKCAIDHSFQVSTFRRFGTVLSPETYLSPFYITLLRVSHFFPQLQFETRWRKCRKKWTWY